MISKFSIFTLSSLFLYFTSYNMELPCNERDELIKTLYNNARTVLRYHNTDDGNSREKTINFLYQLANEARNRCVNEDTIILHAHTQKNEWIPLTSISKEQTIIFCARIKNYHILIKKNDFTTPSPEDFNNYLENKKITATIREAIILSNEVNINLNEKDALSVAPYRGINKNAATEEFETLLNDTDTILLLKSDELEKLANAIVSIITYYTAPHKK